MYRIHGSMMLGNFLQQNAALMRTASREACMDFTIVCISQQRNNNNIIDNVQQQWNRLLLQPSNGCVTRHFAVAALVYKLSLTRQAQLSHSDRPKRY